MITLLPITGPLFARLIERARATDVLIERACTVRDTYADARCFTTGNGRAGYAVTTDGELVSVFSLDRGNGNAIGIPLPAKVTG